MKQLCLSLVLLLAACQSPVSAPSADSQLLNALRTRYDQRVKSFLQTQPMLINGYKHSGSPTGTQFGISSFHYKGHTFALEKVQGQTLGYIDADLLMENTLWGTCGDVKDPGSPGSGFSTERAALAQRSNARCYQSSFVPGGTTASLRFIYVYANGQWSYQTVKQKGELNLEMEPITQVLGASHADQIAVQTPEGLALNQPWRKAFLAEDSPNRSSSIN